MKLFLIIVTVGLIAFIRAAPVADEAEALKEREEVITLFVRFFGIPEIDDTH